MKERTYKKSYKNLVNIFVILAFALLGILLTCFSGYYLMNGAKAIFYITYAFEIAVNAVISGAFTMLVMSGFHKYSSKEIINTKRKKTIFALTTLALTLLFSIATCCKIWYMMCWMGGKVC